MSIKIHIPTPLRPFCDQQDEVVINDATDVSNVFDKLVSQYSGLSAHLFDEDNNLRKFVNVYLNEEDIRYIDGVNSSVKDGDVISIVPSIAGGI